ncbi:MAG: amidohydrolase family protein [Acidimicrobiia bacterium]
MLDVVIVGGEVIDGTGAPRRRADVGIEAGRVVMIGDVDEPAARRLDAEGKVVAPGFIDVHTHYDAQIAWDPYLTPSPLHGVTTVLGGNCGFTLAPMDDDAVEYLTAMLARVEGMPLASVRAGVDFCWRSFGEYLDAIEGRVALNAGFLVGHSTVRRLVLGDDWRRTAGDDEIEAMRRLVAESLAAGALGLSSSWAETHNDAAGDPTPSRFASEDELLRLCGELRSHPGTWLEFIPLATGPFPDDRVALMARMSAAAQRPLNWNLMIVRPDLGDEYVESRLAASDVAARYGGRVFGLTLPIPQTLHINLDSGFLFDSLPAWADLIRHPRQEKLRLLCDPVVRRRLAEVAAGTNRIWYDVERLRFESVTSPRYADVVGRTLAEAARARDAEPYDLMFDVAVADELRTGFVVPPQGDDDESWRRRGELWKDPRVLVGGSDAGAHLDMVDTFGYFTDLVGPSVRDRQLLTLETAVRLVTDDAARAFGLRGRGRLEPGFAADVVVFDEHEVGSMPTEIRADLPADGMRLYAEATGIEAVLVNGQLIVEQGGLTGAQPGTVLRSGRDTETVQMGSTAGSTVS